MHDVVGVDAEVEALVVRFLAQLDLVHRLELAIRPVDDPLRWRLVDARQLVARTVDDFLWLRVLDVSAAFAGRTFGCRDRLVLEVDDALRPAVGGRFAFDGDRAGGACERTAEPADLHLGIAELGSLLLGTIDPSVLAAAGRASGTPEALARADALFRSTPRPFCSTRF